MSLGTGIFLGAAFLGVIFLYTQTKDRWRWGKGLKRLGLSFLALGILAGVGVGGWLGYDRYSNRPAVVRGTNGVNIGDSLADVFFKNGEFEKLPPRDSRGAQKGDEAYKQGRLTLNVREAKVAWISYDCEEGSDYTRVNGVKCGDSGEEVVERLGPARVLCPNARPEDEGKDILKLARVFDTLEFGTRHVMVKNRVGAMTIFPPSELAKLVGFNWVPCK